MLSSGVEGKERGEIKLMSEIEGLLGEETCMSWVSRSTVSTELCEGVDCSTSLSDDGLSNSTNVSLQLTVDVSRDSSRSEEGG